MLHNQAGRRAVREQGSGFFEKVGHFQLQNVPNEGHSPVVWRFANAGVLAELWNRLEGLFFLAWFVQQIIA